MTRSAKIGLLVALYFAQGLPTGFQARALPVYLREQGLSLTGVALAGALALPWMLKVLWSPLVDRYALPGFGRRKSWIVPAQAALALTTGAAALVSPQDDLTLLLVLVFCMNLCAATQDIAVDGLAVDLLDDDELGPGNAAQVVGFKVGMLTSGGLLMAATDRIGWTGLFAAMSGLVVLVLLVSLTFREPAPSGQHAAPQRLKDILRALGRTMTLPGAGWVLAFIATYKLGESMADTMFKPFLVDAGFTAAAIGELVGTYGMAFSVVGSILGGLLAARVPLTRAIAITATLRILPIVGEWWLSTTTPTEGAVLAVTCAEHLFGGMLTPCMFAFMMSRVDRRVGAAHYTLLASVEVFGKAPASWLSGVIADAYGYSVTFGLAVLGAAGFLLLLRPIRRLPQPDRAASTK